MKKILLITLSIMIALSAELTAQLAVSLKELTQVKGVRDNQLQGYGVIVGLEGTGDSNKSLFTMSSIVSTLKAYGVAVNLKDIKVDNAAAVMVTMTLPAFAREGQKMDVIVSSIGDADNLQGGELLQTPLFGADGKVYAVAQGRVSTGGFNVQSGGTKITRNHPTAGRVVNGAIIEKTVETEFIENNQMQLMLKDPDFLMAAKVTEAINLWAGEKIALAVDAGAVNINMPDKYKSNPVLMIGQIEKITITPTAKAKIIVNSKTGTIVMGEGVQLGRAAIAHGNLQVVIRENNEVIQPNPLGSGETVKVSNPEISTSETGGKVMMMNEGATLRDVVKALNSIGATPRDVISILEALKQAGALFGEIESM